MSDDITCTICSENTIGLSPILKITETSRFNWESDSTMKLLGWKETEAQLRFCPKCFHSIIFPKFDASKLYGVRGPEVRKEIYESYFPDKSYGEKLKKINFSQDFLRMSQEFLRFHQTAVFVAKFIQTTFTEIKEIKILDWGGGDGYISSLYSSILRAITGLPVNDLVYDYTNWEISKSKKVGIEDLKKMDKFHVIIFSHILEHTHDPVGTIKSAVPFLEDKGLVICEVPDERCHIIKALLKMKYGLNYHVAHFSKRSLHRVLEHARLNNIHTTYQYNSSFRGNKISSVVGVAQNGVSTSIITLTTTFVEEAFLLVIFTVKKVLTKIFLHFKHRNRLV
jgi:hypothetical protein